MSACGDCRFWLPPRQHQRMPTLEVMVAELAGEAGEFGTCNDGIPYGGGDLAYYQDYEGHSASFYCKAEFSCALWEARTDED